ncbi:MAG TPA: hypothetical protein PLW86_02115 [Rhodocyclaceae bacterium]|nr:hypothetical protein [Rhodocyclaceae bacterium]
MSELIPESARRTTPQVQWRWRAARGLSAIGRIGWMGLAALVLAIATAVSTLPGMWQRLDRLQADAEAERDRRIMSGFNPEAPLPRILAPAGSAADLVAAMNALAQREGIKIERIDYQLLNDSGKPVLQYRADLTAQAPYLKLRQWIDAVLRDRPSVALDELVFERPNASAGEVTARVRFTLFMRGEK